MSPLAVFLILIVSLTALLGAYVTTGQIIPGIF